MTLQELANFATAGSVLVALGTFIVLAVDRARRERQRTIEEWQRVAVYRIVRNNDGPDFSTIRSRYLEEAQLLDDRLPKKAIQENTLYRILMDLTTANLILETNEGRYRWRRVSSPAPKRLPQERLEQMRQFMVEMQGLKHVVTENRPKVLIAVEEHPGITVDKLLRLLVERGASLDYEGLHEIVTLLRLDGLVRRDGDILYHIPDSERWAENEPDVG